MLTEVKQKDTFWVVDKDYPMIVYPVSEKELIELIELTDQNCWWRQFYIKKLLEHWKNSKYNNSSK